jgi:hypothetical protein
MTIRRRIALTVVLLALWLLILAPLTAAGVLSMVMFVVVIALTAAVIVVLWRPRRVSSGR